MDGPSFVAIVEKELKRRGITKAEFYSATGISSATFSQWRNGLYAPSISNIKKVESFIGARFDFSILLNAARDAVAAQQFNALPIEQREDLLLSADTKKAPAADTGDEREMENFIRQVSTLDREKLLVVLDAVSRRLNELK